MLRWLISFAFTGQDVSRCGDFIAASSHFMRDGRRKKNILDRSQRAHFAARPERNAWFLRCAAAAALPPSSAGTFGRFPRVSALASALASKVICASETGRTESTSSVAEGVNPMFRFVVTGCFILGSSAVFGADKPRLYLTESGVTEVNADNLTVRKGTSPENIEVMKAFLKQCPGVAVTSNRDKAEYIVRFDREEPSPITPFVKGTRSPCSTATRIWFTAIRAGIWPGW